MDTASVSESAWPVLRSALKPIQEHLEQPDISEISINGPGQLFIERAGRSFMEAADGSEITADWIKYVSERVAAASRQAVNERTPLLSAALPNGERFQTIIAPAAPTGGAISIRKQVRRNISLEEYEAAGGLDLVRVDGGSGLTDEERELVTLLNAGDIKSFLLMALHHRVSMVISGGTSSGKTTLLNALLKKIDNSERIITIEDTPELEPPHPNRVQLIASKNDQGIADVDVQKLLEASLRMRPERIMVGELRGSEAFSFLQAINTGHPGSLSTVHANSPRGAYERLALMVMQSGVQLSRSEVVDYLREVVPIIVQVGRRENGKRGLTDIYYARAKSSGET